MDLREIRNKKVELEDGIHALLNTFYEVTGVQVKNMFVEQMMGKTQGVVRHVIDIELESI